MKTTSAFLLLFAFIAFGGITFTWAVKDGPTRVIPLTLKNFDTETQSGIWIVELCVSIREFLVISDGFHSFAPWCTHCQEYAKTYDEASLAVTSIKFGKIDCVAEKSTSIPWKVTHINRSMHKIWRQWISDVEVVR